MATINNAIYDEVSDTWWEQDGFMAVLRTSVNPPRFEYFHKVLTQHLGLNSAQLTVLDVGCGGGLLSVQFAQLGCQVTGIDQSVKTLNAAKSQAKKLNLPIQYLESGAEMLPFTAQQLDVVCCCDVLEHVDDIYVVLAEISRVLKPGGIFFFDTINRTFKSKLIAIKIAQDWPLTRFLPRNVHVWEKFIKPTELASSLKLHQFTKVEMVGLSPAINPISAFSALMQKKLGQINYAQLGEQLKLKESADLSISYMGYAT